MSGFDGNGTYVRFYNWTQDAANSIPITASRFDTEHNGFATALTNCITRDGQGKPTADISFNTHGITDLRDPTGNQEPVTLAFANSDSGLLNVLSTRIKYIRTPAEIAASVVPVNYYIPSHLYGPVIIDRYGTNTTPGTTNMTAAITAAITLANAINGANGSAKIVGLDQEYLVSSALPTLTAFGGIDLGAGGIIVSGTGYTAMTIAGAPRIINVMIQGIGNTANGLYLNNVLLVKEANIRVYNLDGFGCKIDKCFDSLFNTISIESCGNASNYAFSMNDAGDTCNMSHILRLQVEKANRKAIFISPNTLSCVIDNVHSEQATGNVADVTWDLGGLRSQYNSIRLSANVPANASVKLTGLDTTWTGLLTEGAMPITFDASSGGQLTLITPEIAGSLSPVGGQFGILSIVGGVVVSMPSSTFIATFGTTIAGVLAQSTWVPVIKFGGGTTGITYSAQAATYQRIGNEIRFAVIVALTSKGSSTGAVTITGLPVASNAGDPLCITNTLCENITYGASILTAIVPASSSAILLYYQSSAATLTAADNTTFANNSTLRISGSYRC